MLFYFILFYFIFVSLYSKNLTKISVSVVRHDDSTVSSLDRYILASMTALRRSIIPILLNFSTNRKLFLGSGRSANAGITRYGISCGFPLTVIKKTFYFILGTLKYHDVYSFLFLDRFYNKNFEKLFKDVKRLR